MKHHRYIVFFKDGNISGTTNMEKKDFRKSLLKNARIIFWSKLR